MTVTDSTGYQCMGADLADPARAQADADATRRSRSATTEVDGVRVTASNPRASETTDAEGTIDCDVMVALPWATLFGVVTIGPDLETGLLGAFGCKADHWISAHLLSALSASLELQRLIAVVEAMEQVACAIGEAVL